MQMTILVAGSAGHLGEALMRTFKAQGRAAIGIDIKPSAFTTHVGSITDREFVASVMEGVDYVLNTATLHKPHVGTHSRQDFVDVNVTGTLNLLEEAQRASVKAFIFTSTTSVFGHAMTPEPGGPASWVTEDITPIAKNIYGATKLAAEDLCSLFWQIYRLPCLVLRTSRFFPEDDDNAETRQHYMGLNARVNELLYRRVDIEDIVSAHERAMDRAPQIGFSKYIISATSPFTQDDIADLRTNGAAVARRHHDFEALYDGLKWTMYDRFNRVYVNTKARLELGWDLQYDFATALERMQAGYPPYSRLHMQVGSKRYHDNVFEDGPFPLEKRADGEGYGHT
jgi:nucleoside-diphosphate-sugar epimerase